MRLELVSLPRSLRDSTPRPVVLGLCLLTLVAGLVPALLVLATTANYGPFLSPDSNVYISLARNLAAGEGFVDYLGGSHASAMWPPLLTVLLASVDKFGPDPFESVRVIHAVAFGLTIAATSIWLNHNVRSRLIQVGGFALDKFFEDQLRRVWLPG